MKAKEYAQRYLSAPTVHTLKLILRDFLLEAEEIRQARSVHRDTGLVAIFEEQAAKWRAFVNLIDERDVRRDGFERALEHMLPEAYRVWMRERARIQQARAGRQGF